MVYLLKMGGFSMVNCECHNQMDPCHWHPLGLLVGPKKVGGRRRPGALG
jgi:hypothetical protein